jgi:hypothetical protein
MKHTTISKILFTLFAVVLCFGPVGLAEPVGTAFTYQGRLIDANQTADGLYDFQFKLFDAASAGNQIGLDVNLPEVDVIDGYFTVELDSGSGVFDGNERWLEIGVRPGDLNDPNVYTTLTPRQEVTPAPHAIYADSSNWNNLIDIPSDIAGIQGTDIANWNTAYNWGDHSVAGYLTSIPSSVMVEGENLSLLNNDAGYMTGYTEVDPIFVASSASAIQGTDINNWNTAYNWGDHNLAGYLTSIPASVMVEGENVSLLSNDAGYMTSYSETDPIFVASSASAIQGTDITNWNTAYGWGDHSLAGYLTMLTLLANDGTGSTLDADLLDGLDSAAFALSGHNHDTSYVNEGQLNSVTGEMIVTGTVTSSDLQNGAALAEIVDNDGSGSGLDADLLDGYQSGNLSGQIPISNGTLSTNLHADRLDSYHAGNSSGQVAVSNLTVCTNLNADYLDGLSSSSFVTLSTDYGRLNVSSNLYEGPNTLTTLYINEGQVAGGDLSGTYPNPTVAKLQTRTVSSSAPSTAQILKWSGSQWAPAADGLSLPFTGSASSSLNPALEIINTASANDEAAVFGKHYVTDFYGIGVAGRGGYKGVSGEVYPIGSGLYYGVYGLTTGGAGDNYGVYGKATNSSYENYGIYGSATGPSGSTNYGVYGEAMDVNGVGVSGDGGLSGIMGSGGSYGVVGSGTFRAGYFIGNVDVTGTLTKAAGSFRIDHPLDPENKYLSHSFVESPDMMNVYNGNIILDKNGQAVVVMPDWFEALNRDFRYQLTCIGGFAPIYVAEKIQNNRFKIAGGTAGLEVSWQVTGIRHDPYAEAHRIVVEEDKQQDEHGKYLHPIERGLSNEKSISTLPVERKPVRSVQKTMKSIGGE